MISPYKEYLSQFANMTNIITIEREGAPDVTGKVKEVDDYGCVIEGEPDKDLQIKTTFVIYENMRGVSQVHEYTGKE